MQKHILATVIALVAIAPSAHALVQVGARPASFVVKDLNDRELTLATLVNAAPALILYVDKEGAAQNKRLEARLQKLRAEEPAFAALRYVPIVDMSKYNGWPERGFAKSALRDEQKTYAYKLYADWDGAGHAKLSTVEHASNLIVLDKQGRVAWASAGQLSPTQEDALIARLRDVATK